MTDRQVQILLKAVAGNLRYKLLTYLMLDGGMRVTEAVTLRLGNLLLREKLIRVKSLKKRGEVYRDVPMSAALINALAEYLASWKGDKQNPDSYLFPSGGGHLKRKAVWAYYRRLKHRRPELGRIHPHALRHTFATRLVGNKVDLLTAKELLGHSTIKTTEIYTHIPAEVLRSSIESLNPAPGLIERLNPFKKRQKNVPVLRLNSRPSLCIGRDKELAQIEDLTDKRVNILVRGEQGIGKTQLLSNIKIEGQKIVRLDEMRNVKSSLVNFALHVLKNDKEELRRLLYNDTEWEAKVSKETNKNLVSLLVQITERYEYTVIIDDVTTITPTGVKVLEEMRNHFHLICGARQVAIDKASFLSNFQMVDLKPLGRPQTLELIHRLSYDVMAGIEDYDLYKNHIWEQTGGVPGYVYEVVERYRKEDYISNEVIREVRHTGGKREIDFTPVILVSLGALIVLRYFGREVGEGGYQLIGGIALVFALFARQFFRSFRRKFV